MEQLKRLRSEKGLSQAKLAALADVDPSTVNQIERGVREASPATLRKLAEALDVSIAELLDDAAPKAPRRSPLEPTLNGLLEEERRLIPWRAYRDELQAVVAGARAILEKVPSFSQATGQDVAPEIVLSLWNGHVNALQEDALTRREMWREPLAALSDQDLSREEEQLVDEVGRWLESYQDTVEKLRAKLVADWEAAKLPGELLHFPERRAG
jgi:transcriptional regulator with XRE-family HTH domain